MSVRGQDFSVPVKRVIRSKATKLYLRDDGSWTAEFHEAKACPDIQTAISIVQTRQLEQVELVLQFSDEPSSQYDVVLPLTYARHVGFPQKPLAN